MATSVYFDLDKRYKKQDQTYPLKLFIVHNRKSTSIAIGYSILDKDWSNKQHKIKHSCKKYTWINSKNYHLTNLLNTANGVIDNLISSGEIKTIDLHELKKRILNKLRDYDFVSFTEELIDDFKEKQKFGNVKVYQETLAFVKKRFSDRKISFTQIDKHWLQQTQDEYIQAGNGFGGLSIRLRTIRSIFNKAIDKQIISPTIYPFKNFKIKNASRKRKIAVPRDAIIMIEEYDPPRNSKKWHYKNYFLMMFYMRGANFHDIARLNWINIRDGQIIYHRGKTHTEFIVKVTDKIQNILNHYIDSKKSEEDYIFPILESKAFTEQDYKQIPDKLKYFNKGLRQIGDEIGIEAHLTSYVARHTWATLADQKGADRRVIQKGLGHADLRTTTIYIDDIHVEKELDRLNDDILK